MATCKDCLYYDVCPLGLAIKGATGICLKFKNKADFEKVVRCKDCKHFIKVIEKDNNCYCVLDDKLIKTKLDGFCDCGERKDT